MWIKTVDGSIVDTKGKVIFFSTDRFVKDICLGDCCFICGARPDEREFNNEHILPEWLLRRYDLFARTIVLPNGVEVRYDRYTVPCCIDCNSLMGEVIEQPISEAVRQGTDAIREFASKGGLLKIFVWMGLIFLKTHLRDRTFRRHIDARKGEERIADEYDWELLHHIHTVVRCFYTGCSIQPEVIGSFLALPVRAQALSDRFDFGDLYLAQTMLLRLDDSAMLTVFNDSGGALSCLWDRLERIKGPLSEFQLREIMVDLAFLSLHLKELPTFSSEINLVNEKHRIVCTRPTLELAGLDLRARGRLLQHALGHVLSNVSFIGRTQEEVQAAIKAGTFSFLFDDNGEFVEEQLKPDKSAIFSRPGDAPDADEISD